MTGEMRFTEHLGELRQRFKVVFLTLLVIFIALIVVPRYPAQFLSLTGTYNPLVSVFLDRIVQDILPAGWTLIGFHVNEGLEIVLVASLVLAVAFDMPVIAYETFRFIDPALKENERKLVYPFVISSSILFLIGLGFGYFILSKFLLIALTPFFVAGHLAFTIEGADFYYVVFLTVFFSGVAFTIPVFVYLIIRFGIVEASFFSKNRVYIWFGTYILTAIITPDGGPLLDVILFFPVIALLELAVFFGKRYSRGAPRAASKGRRCSYCDSPLDPAQVFCTRCGRANA